MCLDQYDVHLSKNQLFKLAHQSDYSVLKERWDSMLASKEATYSAECVQTEFDSFIDLVASVSTKEDYKPSYEETSVPQDSMGATRFV